MREVALVSRNGDAAPSRGATGSRTRGSRAGGHGHRLHAKQHYFAFLSYSHADQAIAEWLHEALEKFRVSKRLVGRLTENGPVPRRLTPIFRDRGELAAADNLGEEIEEALAGSRFMIVLCSPAAVASRWTNAEIAAFKRLHPGGEVLAAIVDGEPFASDIPGRESEECFPPALLEKYDRLGRPTGNREEPIAADLREDRDGRQGGLLKIIAGMLGVGLDDLVQRETHRRYKRLAYLAGGSLVGMAVAIGLMITAIQARDAARDQRREAESLVAFMLGDLKEQLEPIGKLEALGGVGSRVLAYYSKQDTSELSDAGLLQRAQALSLTAQVANARGDLNTAQGLYRQAMQGTAEAIRRDPGNPQRLFDHAQNVFEIGEIARDRGEYNQAEAAYREYKKLADQMVAIEPDNLKWRIEVLYAQENIGIVLFNKRQYPEAAAIFEGSLRAMESLASLDPGNREYQNETGTLLSWVAQAQWVLGRLADAIAVRQRQVAFLERQLRGGSTNVQVREKLIPARRALGLLFTSRGQIDRGIEEFHLALGEANRLIAVEPDNSDWKNMAAAVQLDLAQNLLSRGRRDEAAREIAAACAVAAALRASDPKVSSGRALQTTCLDRRSRLALASGKTAQALALAEQAFASAGSERSADPVTDRYRVAAQARLLGDVRRRAGDREGATAAWSAGLAQLPRNIAERPWEMNERAELLRRLGRADEARPLSERLAAIGHRRTM